MKDLPRDTRWLRRPPLTAARLRAWLTDRGSLTARLEARCDRFAVKVLFQGRARIDRDERFLRNGALRGKALVREVCLLCGDTPVVFAHTVIEPRAMHGAWRRIATLGSRSLGAALFADPRVERHPLRQKKLGRHHELYRRARAALGVSVPLLWARRSLFTRHKSPILVTEVFLPEIARL